MSLNWTVRYRAINGPKGQRANLLLWRVVRKLEKTLNEMSQQIIESNNVAINNSALLQGVQYIFTVFGVSDSGEVGYPDKFSIKYSEAETDPTLQLRESESSEQFSVLIYGSDTAYVDIPYIVEAHVVSCKPTNDYYFEWKVFDMMEKKAVFMGPQRSKKLVIPHGQLIGGRNYDITCKIYHIANKKFITKSGIFLSILKRGLTLDLSCERMDIAKNIPFSVMAILNNPDNIKEPSIFKWNCKIPSSSNDCNGFASPNSSEVNLEAGFSDEGMHQVTVNVMKGDLKISKQCDITVQDAMLPLVDIDQTKKVFASNELLEIRSEVSDLRPGCSLQWLVMNEKGFSTIDSNLLPEIFHKKLVINSFEETFLSEMVEFGNTSFTRNYPLIIPKANANWPGLEPEANYKFRLEVKCVCTPSVQCDGPNEIIASSDITIHTNGPPVLQTLNVNPPLGNALQTVFTFSTKIAIDIPTDYPLRYMFGIKISLNKGTVYINSYLDQQALETFLPFSDTPLIPVLTVCDSRGACDSIEGDPVLIGTPTSITSDQMNYYKDMFKSNFYRREYKDAFYLATAVLSTLQALDNTEVSGDFLTFIEQETRSNVAVEIGQSDKIDVQSATILVQEATYFIQRFSNTSEEFLQDILKLRDTLYDISQSSTKINDSVSTRKKRHITTSPLTRRQKRETSLEDVDNFLKISQLIINSSKDETNIAIEKSKLLVYIKKSIPDLCKRASKYSNSLDSQIVSMDFEKLTVRPNMPFIFIPYAPHANGKIGSKLIANMQFANLDKMDNKIHCLAKFLFSVDILPTNMDKNSQGPIYYVSLHSDDGLGYFKEAIDSYPVMLKIPVQITDISETYECRRWQDNLWLEGTCETNYKYETINSRSYVVCRCDNVGFIRLYVVQRMLEDVTDEIIYPELITTDIYITDTTFDSQMITTQLPLLSTLDAVSNDIICDGNACHKSEEINIASIVTPVIIILLSIAMIFFIVMRRKRNKKPNSYNKLQPVRKSLVKGGPKYRKFYADHLMEGSEESLGW